METALILLVCTAAAVHAQLLNPISTMMGPSFGNPMWHSGMRYPGVMQSSQVNSMTYPTWRTHPIFRMSSSDKNYGSNLPSDVTNVPKVPGSQEVLTHMALANQNPKPYLDTISDFFYEPQKARTVFTPVAPVASVAPMVSKAYADAVSDYVNEYQKARNVMAPVASVASEIPLNSMASVASMASVPSKPYIDAVSDYLNEYQKARAVFSPMTSTGSVASGAPMYMQGLNLLKTSANMDDCVQEGARWERGMDWLY